MAFIDESESKRLIGNLSLELGKRKWLLIYETPDGKSAVLTNENVPSEIIVALLRGTANKIKELGGEFEIYTDKMEKIEKIEKK